MEFVRRFEDHQVERIRRAMLAYRTKHNIGDVTLAGDLADYLSPSVSNDAMLKNLQRLRKGERMRGATFLNACVKFLEVNMATPPEEELGLAMKQFVGMPLRLGDLWAELAGDYALVATEERGWITPAETAKAWTTGPLAAVVAPPKAARSIPVKPMAVVSIEAGEGKDYGIACERYVFGRDDDADPDDPSPLDRNGICLPIGRQDLLIMIRDFLFSHMYVLKREPYGFAGTMIMPTASDFFAEPPSEADRQSHYNVALHRVPGLSEL